MYKIVFPFIVLKNVKLSEKIIGKLINPRVCMPSLFLFVFVLLQSISSVFCADDILDASQGKKYPWISGTLFDYRLIDQVYESSTENASTTSYFCQIKYKDPNQVNLYSFGLVSELTSERTGKRYYFTEAFVDMQIQGNKVTTEVHPFGIKENGNKIQRLKSYLEKLRSKTIVPAGEERIMRVRDIEELMRLTKYTSWNIFGLSF